MSGINDYRNKLITDLHKEYINHRITFDEYLKQVSAIRKIYKPFYNIKELSNG